jgi:hypothetical protein
MPEPTTTATGAAVPTNSAAAVRLGGSGVAHAGAPAFAGAGAICSSEDSRAKVDGTTQ